MNFFLLFETIYNRVYANSVIRYLANCSIVLILAQQMDKNTENKFTCDLKVIKINHFFKSFLFILNIHKIYNTSRRLQTQTAIIKMTQFNPSLLCTYMYDFFFIDPLW